MSGSRILLEFEGRDLIDLDVFSKSDPFVVVYQRFEDSDEATAWKEVGRTETIMNQRHPKFKTRVEAAYEFNHQQGLRFEVYDRDGKSNKLDAHDFIGYAECSVAKLLTAKGQRLKFELKHDGKKARDRKKRGFLKVTAEESLSAKERLVIGLDAENLKLGALGKPICLLTVSALDESKWQVLASATSSRPTARTKYLRFMDLVVRLQTLKHFTDQTQVRLQLYKGQEANARKSLGSTAMSWGQLKALAEGSRQKLQDARGQDAGALVVRTCRIEKEVTFLDYLAGGHQIELAVAIDFTGSNGNPALPTSLHHFGNPAAPNEYVRAISAVGNILAAYDSDNMIPAFGFGAKLAQGPGQAPMLSHCFNLNGNPADPNCFGVEGVLGAYHAALSNTTLSGPTVFSEIIRKVAAETVEKEKQEHMAYTILLIITDGVISSTDLQTTIHQVVQASRLPMSIVIVGVGNANFDKMDMLDADDTPLVSNGKKMEADIVQFVPFRKFERSAGMLAAEVLDEVPGQFLQYMKRKGIRPKPPREATETASNYSASAAMGRFDSRGPVPPPQYPPGAPYAGAPGTPVSSASLQSENVPLPHEIPPERPVEVSGQPPAVPPQRADEQGQHHHGAPPPYYGAPPQYYGAPPQYYGAPPPYYGAPPQYHGAPPQYHGAPPQYPGAPPQYPGAPPQYPGPAPQYAGAPAPYGMESRSTSWAKAPPPPGYAPNYASAPPHQPGPYGYGAYPPGGYAAPPPGEYPPGAPEAAGSVNN